MRIVVCDDDEIFGKQLIQYLQEYFQSNHLALPVIDFFNDGETLLENQENIDIAFLDVEMPGLSGIYVGEKLKCKNPRTIVFIITAYPDYLDEAMRFQVFRYLSKPLDKRRLFRNLKDALHCYNTTVSKIAIETQNGVETVYLSDIICVETMGRKTVIYTINGSCQSIYNMQYWIEHLKMGCFFQTHRSYIVNMRYVTDFDNSMVALGESHIKAYLARRKYREFKDAYLLYMESMR